MDRLRKPVRFGCAALPAGSARCQASPARNIPQHPHFPGRPASRAGKPDEGFAPLRSNGLLIGRPPSRVLVTGSVTTPTTS